MLLKAPEIICLAIDAFFPVNYSQQSEENSMQTCTTKLCITKYASALPCCCRFESPAILHSKPVSIAVKHYQGIVVMFTFEFATRLDDFES